MAERPDQEREIPSPWELIEPIRTATSFEATLRRAIATAQRRDLARLERRLLSADRAEYRAGIEHRGVIYSAPSWRQRPITRARIGLARLRYRIGGDR